MKRSILVFLVLTLIACDVAAQPTENCNPEGLMLGFPPPQEKQVARIKGERNWLRYPNIKWSFQHTRELVPTRLVARGSTTTALPVAPKKLDDLVFDDDGKHTTFEAFIRDTHTDAIIVLHRGKIIYERYENCMKPETYHLLFSASKSFAGLVVAIMASQGDLDENAPVSKYVPPLATSAYGDATLRQVLDMRVGVKFSETYTGDPQSDIYRYLGAADWFPNLPPSNLYAALQNLKEREGPHGGKFDYKSPNADVLAWIVSKVSNRSLSELVSELIWSKIGAERDAYYIVDPLGKESAFGGLNVTLRDFARFGQVMLQMGNWDGQQVAPRSVIEDIMKGGECKAFPNAREPTLRTWSYRSQWWVMHNKNGAYMARGVHGQRLYIDPEAELVVAKFGAAPEPNPRFTDTSHQNAFDALATRLQNEE